MVLMILFFLGVGAAAKKEESLEQLAAQAKAAQPDKQPDLYMEIAQREMKAADDALKAGNSDDFLARLQDVVTYCDSAHAAALQYPKHVKNTEIRIRRISTHLREVKFNADFDDQPKVQKAIDQLETFRTELFQRMFGGQKR